MFFWLQWTNCELIPTQETFSGGEAVHCELYQTTVNSTQNTFSFVKNLILMYVFETVLKYIVANHTKKSYLQMAVKITRSGP